MAALHKYTTERLNSVPVRYKKFVNPRVYEPTNRAYTAVILANEQSARTEAGKKIRVKTLDVAIRQIMSLQKPLLAVWNLMDIKEESAKDWTEKINREIALIWGVTKRPKEEQPMFIALPKAKMKRLAFLETLAELHKYTYTKIGHAPDYCKDTLSNRIADFIDTALYEVILANHHIPTTKAEAQERENHLQAAINSLNGMQRPLLSLWLIMEYSEATMDEWAGLLDKELRLLDGLKTADRERYKNLK